MPAPELSHRYQKALLWTFTGYDEQGQPTRSTLSTEIIVRWTWGQTRMLDPQNNVVSVDATAIVDRDIFPGSVMWEGSLEDLAEELPGTGTADGTDVPTSYLMQVVSFKVAPDLKNRFRQWTVGLKYLADSIPTASN